MNISDCIVDITTYENERIYGLVDEDKDETLTIEIEDGTIVSVKQSDINTCKLYSEDTEEYFEFTNSRIRKMMTDKIQSFCAGPLDELIADMINEFPTTEKEILEELIEHIQKKEF